MLCQIGLLGQSSGDFTIPPFQEVAYRETSFPLKDQRTIYTDSLIEVAHQNITTYTSARSIRDRIVSRANYWLEFDDEELSNIITAASVPRAFDLCVQGCPVHGDSIFKSHGSYPWIIDPKHPFQVKCPIDGQVFPTNDYTAYYKSGFKEKKGWDTEYVDDGWGWVSPSGDRYWFVAHANQWIWKRHVIPGLSSLAQAYLLTGENKYAFKANDMLYRIACVYPSMDHENQSRYGLLMKQRNVRYSGKILNKIWETFIVREIAHAYDMVWDQFDNNLTLQKDIEKTGVEIRAFIEANLLEDALEAIKVEKILGNFGMHQHTTVALHLTRQYAEQGQAFDFILNNPSTRLATTGLRYALYNQVGRDGIPFESPGYNNIWVVNFTDIAAALMQGGIDLFSEFRLKKMLDSPLDLVSIGLYTPDCGDGGSVMGGLVGRNLNTYHIAYNYYKDNRYLNWINLSGGESFTSFASLFRSPLPSFTKLDGRRAVPLQSSRLFAGYGLGVLNNKQDNTAVAFTYGMHYSHYHWDFLNIEVFANGQKMMPDLGYPDAMNDFVSGIFSWSTNTISHNTVVVDQQRQQRNQPGTLHDFTEGAFARVMDASSPAYPGTKKYRRNIVMVDTDEQHSYFIDFFHVEGGTRHDYSLHGPPGKVISTGSTWSETLPGTFAGTDVSIGYMYDNQELREKGHQIGYSGYRGSGFQHLFNVQQLVDGDGELEYHHIRDNDARLRILFLPDSDQEVHMAEAYDKPRARDHTLKYLIATRKSENGEPLDSRFVSVLEPYYKENRHIQKAKLGHLSYGSGQVVIIDRDTVTDVIIYDPLKSNKKLNDYNIETDAACVVASFSDNSLVRLFFSQGTYLHTQEKKFTSKEYRGTVSSVNHMSRLIRVKGDFPKEFRYDSTQSGVAYFSNAYRTTVHPIQSISQHNGFLKVKTKDDILIGRINVKKVDENRLEANNVLTFASSYTGATLFDKNFKQIGLVSDCRRANITLEKETHLSLPLVGDEAWISNIGVGDTLVIHPAVSWEK